MGASCSRVKQSDIALPQQAWHTHVDKDCPIHGEAAMKRNQKPQETTETPPVIAAEEEKEGQQTHHNASITTSTSTNRHAFRAKHTHKVGGRKTDLQLFRPATTTSFIPGEAVTFEVEIRNPATKPFDPARTQVIFMDNGYFKQTSVALAEQKEALALALAAPGQAITLTMIVEPKRARMTLKDVKGECEVRVVSEGEEGAVAVLSQVFVFEAMDFAGDLTSASSSSSSSMLNVYLMGGTQTGKTTFLETLRSVLLPPTAAEEQTPTPAQTLECIELPTLQARFFDMWGVGTTTTHDEQLLACVLRGEAPLGFAPTTHISEEEKATLQSTKDERAAHAVLFFVAADDVETNPSKMKALKSTFEQIKNSMEGETHTHTHTPLVVITRVDLVEPPIASDPAKVAQLRRRVSQYFGVSWSNTLVFVPYAAPHTHTHTHTQKHMGVVGSTSSSRSLRSLMSKKSTSNVQQEEGEKEGREGKNRSFDIDRLVLLIAKTALEAAREKKVEGGCEEEGRKKMEGRVGISMLNKEKMKRLATVELEMDGSFSSNFRGRIASPV